MRTRLSIIPLLFTLVAPASGQSLEGLGGPVAEADLLYTAGEPLLAYERLLELLGDDPTNYDVLWRVARAGVAVGVGREGTRAQNPYLDTALHFGRIAVEQRPDGVLGIYWRAAAAGRRALNAGPRYSLELAQLVYDDAHTLLQMDSLHAGAHNMLGKLNFEVMILSRVQRFIARVWYGSDTVGQMSWANAEAHLTRATELEPDNVLYLYDLGHFYHRRGRHEEAAAALSRALELPASQPVDPMLQEWASALLEPDRG